MSSEAVDNQLEDEEVTCVLVPLTQADLLIPNVCVAEVLPWRRTKPLSGVPPWCIGVLGWRGQTIVVLDFEALLTGEQTAPGGHRAMLVMNRTKSLDGPAFYALATAGLPRLIHVSSAELESDTESYASPCVAMRTTVGTESALIPEFFYLEEQVRRIL